MNLEHDNQDDGDVLRRLAELPRTLPIDTGGADRVVAQLRREGFFRPRRPALSWGIRAAAAILLFTLGAFAGTRYARGSSLEHQLARGDLPASQRVLLLQRAGSAYVRAAQLAPVDSIAAQVARQTLLGAAGAVARLAPPQPIIWF